VVGARTEELSLSSESEDICVVVGVFAVSTGDVTRSGDNTWSGDDVRSGEVFTEGKSPSA
jgi:hypothetical protein